MNAPLSALLQSTVLQKWLGLPFAIAIMAGSVIGAGILRTPGVAANEIPVFWIAILVWALGGVSVLLSVNVAAALTSALPPASGIYVPVLESFGDCLLGRRSGLELSPALLTGVIVVTFVVEIPVPGDMPGGIPGAPAPLTAPAMGWAAIFTALQMVPGAYDGWQGPKAANSHRPARSAERRT